MKTVTQHIRAHILQGRGLREIKKIPSLESLKKTEWSTEFEQYMRNRLIMGAIRYGLLKSSEKAQYNRVDSIRQHLDLYMESGNAEHLVDIANLSLCEFEEPNHPKFHFKAQDDSQHTKKLGE